MRPVGVHHLYTEAIGPQVFKQDFRDVPFALRQIGHDGWYLLLDYRLQYLPRLGPAWDSQVLHTHSLQHFTGFPFCNLSQNGGPSIFAPAVLALSAVAPLLQLKGKNYLARSKTPCQHFCPVRRQLDILKVAKASNNNYHSTYS